MQFTGCNNRWPWPFSGTFGISCCQIPFARWQSCYCKMRRINTFGTFLQVNTLSLHANTWNGCKNLTKFFFRFSRNKVKYLAYLRKRCNVNPARGPYHFRAPCRIFYKAVRGKFQMSTKRSKPVYCCCCWFPFGQWNSRHTVAKYFEHNFLSFYSDVNLYLTYIIW